MQGKRIKRNAAESNCVRKMEQVERRECCTNPRRVLHCTPYESRPGSLLHWISHHDITPPLGSYDLSLTHTHTHTHTHTGKAKCGRSLIKRVIIQTDGELHLSFIDKLIGYQGKNKHKNNDYSSSFPPPPHYGYLPPSSHNTKGR